MSVIRYKVADVQAQLDFALTRKSSIGDRVSIKLFRPPRVVLADAMDETVDGEELSFDDPDDGDDAGDDSAGGAGAGDGAGPADQAGSGDAGSDGDLHSAILDAAAVAAADEAPPADPCFLAISRAAVGQMQGKSAAGRAAFAAGYTLWSDAHLAVVRSEVGEAEAQLAMARALAVGVAGRTERIDRAKALVSGLTLSLVVQKKVRRVNQGMRGAPACLETTDDVFAYLAKLDAVFVDQIFLLSQMAPRRRIFDSKRRRDRVLHVCNNALLAFCVPRPPLQQPGEARRPPVLLVGDYAWSRKASAGFAFRRLLRHLAQWVIVIIVGEHRTSKLCTFCGAGVKHPQPGTAGDEFRGTVGCRDTNCVSRGRLQNRDVAAACSIANLFVYKFVMGGQLGTFSETEVLTADYQPTKEERRLSMFLTFWPPPFIYDPVLVVGAAGVE